MLSVYEPAEDTMLLLNHSKKRVMGSVLDLGTGSGIIAVTIADDPFVTRVFASDINPQAIQVAIRRAQEANVEKKIEFNVGDLFDGINERFDWILFNPPYLSSEGFWDEFSWSGGSEGYETIERFLDQAEHFLKFNGSIIMIYSSFTGLKLDEIKKKYRVEILEELNLFYESLYCLLLRPISLSESLDKSHQ